MWVFCDCLKHIVYYVAPPCMSCLSSVCMSCLQARNSIALRLSLRALHKLLNEHPELLTEENKQSTIVAVRFFCGAMFIMRTPFAVVRSIENFITNCLFVMAYILLARQSPQAESYRGRGEVHENFWTDEVKQNYQNLLRRFTGLWT